MVSAKRSLSAKVDLPFDDYHAYFCTYVLNPLQMPIGMETYHFQPSPATYGPNPYLDPLFPLYVTVLPRSLFQSIARTRFSRKSTILIGLALTVFEL